MALPINIEDLLNRRKIESNRIEFKKGWNPTDVYRSIGAFANDFDNLGGGYILIGVEEKNGVAQRPVTGVNPEVVDGIMKQMVGFNNLIEPYYMPRTSVEEIDGKTILVIWIPAGVNRPYAVPSDVLAKVKKPVYCVRDGSSSIVAKGEVLDELRDMANRVPFDERPNSNIKLTDISMALLRDYLAKVDSRLEKVLFTQPLEQTLEQMDLMDGPSESRMVKNVAAMMFCEHPERIFRYTQVDIVIFPEGRISDPNNFSETTIYGSVPQLIQGSLTYLKNNIIREYVKKQKNVPESIRFFNYPIQALEEAIVNALYHRDYQQYEPVEISVEPDGIHILSIPGPDRSISQAVIDKGERMISRRYRNRRLGDFLKELDLTEGRSTGIPTIQEELKKNGSPRATVETNSERSFVNVFIPVHKGCGKRVVLNAPVNAPANAPANVPANVPVNVPVNVPANAPVNVPVSTPITLIKTQERIMKLLKGKGSLTFEEMAKELKVTRKTIQRNIAKLKSMGLIERVGEDKNGYWKLNI